MGEPNNTPSLLGEAFRSELEGIVKKAVKEAMSQNGHHEMDALISADTAAKRWEVPKTWIESMARRGELPYVQLGVYKRFNPADLEKFVRERRRT